jgi:hypothetical protein
MEQFLNKLPSNVIKNGKLIDVRNDLSNLINGSEKNETREVASQISVIETSDLEELRKRYYNFSQFLYISSKINKLDY